MSPDDLLRTLSAHAVVTGPLPTHPRLKYSDWLELDEDAQRELHQPAARAIRELRNRDAAEAAIAGLGSARYEAAVPVLAALWRSCPVSPVRESAGRALQEIGSSEAWAALWDTRDLFEPERARMAACCLLREPNEAWERCAPTVSAAREGDAGAKRLLGEVLSHLAHHSLKSVPGGGYQRLYEAGAAPQLMGDPRWIELAIDSLQDDDLEDVARQALGEAEGTAIEAVLAGLRAGHPLSPPSVARRDFFSRYSAGDLLAWNELADVGPIGGDLRIEANELATVLFRRLRENLTTIQARLVSLGWTFRTEPPLTQPSDVEEALRRLQREVGDLPASLIAASRILGGVDFRPVNVPWEAFPGVPAEWLDPLEFFPLPDILFALDDWTADRQEAAHPLVVGPLDLPVAADRYHKLDISGGPPYALRLPEPGADPWVVRAPERLRLVAYFRNAVAWGGLPGIAHAVRRQPRAMETVRSLSLGLEPF